MIYEVSESTPRVNFAPSSELDEILQNVYTIISTSEFSVPMFRAFGTRMSYLDAPDEISKARTISEIIDKVETFENRVFVEEVRFRGDQLNGYLFPTVLIRLKNEVIENE